MQISPSFNNLAILIFWEIVILMLRYYLFKQQIVSSVEELLADSDPGEICFLEKRSFQGKYASVKNSKFARGSY